ncbi:MAG TPA: prolyl oligopeptidase family serine peptidase [Steroidobacteraceae bacterium]|jgi:dipeptidyl aminopeptidase/acylaminoacyl peptidase|nr:prolyl oligopeptidase family serine peptidase [Steroidobacteraceae bacterium]
MIQPIAISALSVMASAAAMAAANQAAPPLSIAQIASAPFPYDLTASPIDGAVAWVYNERGARNVWVAQPGSHGGYSARRLTPYSVDDGNVISNLAWNGDGKTLFYTRGGVTWNAEIAVNPLSLPSGPRAGAVWAVSLNGGAPRRVGEGTMPAPSPKGDVVVFLHDGQPWVTPSYGTATPEPLFIDRGRVVFLAWSPDGDRLAFVSGRPAHSIVGVYDFGTKSIQWIAPGIDYDTDPIWSPDGKRIAFVRVPSDPVVPFTSSREGTPWEIWVADAATGRGGRIWRAGEGVGSRFRLLFNSRDSIFWGAGDRLVFPWEVSGWVRLYSISAAGGEPLLLTPGESEVFGAQLSNDRTHLVYSSNEGDLDRRHIWELSVAHGRPHQVTRGDGVEDMPAIAVDNRIFALRGEARIPLRPAQVTDDGMADLAPEAMPKDFPSRDLVVPQLVSFKADDGTMIHGQLFIPRGRTLPGPALLFFHGGPTNRQMFAAWDPFETHSHLYESSQYLANHGYVVLSVNYRGGAGYGFEYREPPRFGAGGASELDDIIAAAKYMQSRPDVDPKRLGVWGGSYGGRMTLLALAEAPQYFAAGASYSGIYDWVTMPEFDVNGARPGSEAAVRLAYDSGPVAHMEKWRAPVLLMLGDADPIVNIEQTTALAAVLRRKKIPVDVLMIPDEVHFLLKDSSWNRVFEATKDYFDGHL